MAGGTFVFEQMPSRRDTAVFGAVQTALYENLPFAAAFIYNPRVLTGVAIRCEVPIRAVVNIIGGCFICCGSGISAQTETGKT